MKQKATLEQLGHISAMVEQNATNERFQQHTAAVKQKATIEQFGHISAIVEQKAMNERLSNSLRLRSRRRRLSFSSTSTL